MEFSVSRHFNIKFYNFLTINYNANPQPIDGGSVWKMEGPNPQHPMFCASAITTRIITVIVLIRTFFQKVEVPGPALILFLHLWGPAPEQLMRVA